MNLKYTIYLYCTITAWIMPTLCPFLTVPCLVGLQSVAFLGHTLSFFETIITVDDNTIVLNNIRLNYKSALA